jgi:hypothetical protein
LLLAQLVQLVLEVPEVMWPLLIVALSSSKACIVLLLGSGDFISSRRLPLVDGAWDLVSVKSFTMYHFV